MTYQEFRALMASKRNKFVLQNEAALHNGFAVTSAGEKAELLHDLIRAFDSIGTEEKVLGEVLIPFANVKDVMTFRGNVLDMRVPLGQLNPAPNASVPMTPAQTQHTVTLR